MTAEMDVEGLRLSDEDRDRCKSRFERGAYYYSFEGTGVEAIDLILGAVSAAGKAFHHTESWTDKADGSGGIFASSPFDAGSCVDLIDAAASEAAALFRSQAEEIERLERASMEEFQPENQRLRDQVFTLTRQLQEAVEERDRLRSALSPLFEDVCLIGVSALRRMLSDHHCERLLIRIERARAALTERSKP